MQRLNNQVALITGANSGIGAEIGKAMASEGASVVINYPFKDKEPEALHVKKIIEKDGGRAMIFKADISEEDEIIAMFQQIKEKFGTIDILVNNAGIQNDAPFAQMTLEQWNQVLKVNLTGHFLCSREAIKEFIRKKPIPDKSAAAGKIIFISSVHEVIPWAGHANYAASKGGVMMLMKSMAQEFASQKIRINSIAPGAIKTHINLKAWNTEEAEQNLLKLIPYNRIGETTDIGKVAVWLASDESDYITGTTIYVDGGMTLYPGFATNG